MTVGTPTANTAALAASAWKKYQAPVKVAIRQSVEEIARLKRMKDAKFTPTLREVLAPVIVSRSGGAGSVPETAYKMYPRTANPVDTTWTLLHHAARMAVTFKSIDIQRRDGQVALLSMLKLGAMSTAETIAAHIGDYFYAPSTAILATSDSDLASAATSTLTLANGFNQSTVTNAAYIAARFRGGLAPDRVALLLSGTRVTNAVGTIESVIPATPAISVIWDGTAPGNSTNGFQIVKANSLDNTVDDYNRGLSANWCDIRNASAMGGLTTASQPEWALAGSNSSVGRCTYVVLQAAIDAVSNTAPEPPDTFHVAQGVLRDMHQNYEGQMRFESGETITLNGNLDVGLDIFTSRRVPPGQAMVYDSAQWQIFYGKPEEALNEEDAGIGDFSDLYESENQYQYYADVNWIGNTVLRSWRSFYLLGGITEQ